MSSPITFFFDFGSPYAWLTAEQIDGVAARHRRTIRWRAILLGVVFRETGMAPLHQQHLRGAYAAHDVARLARRLGLPFARAALAEGSSLALARCFHALDIAGPDLAARFARIALRASFGDGREVRDLDAAQALAATLSAEAGAAASQAMAPETRAALRGATREALSQGVFGAPFFLVDGEPFWGQDRLPLLEAWLADPPR